MLRDGRALSHPPAEPQRQPPLPIPRVRKLLRRASSDVFTPQTVLIGPYHVQAGSYLFQSRGVKNMAVQNIVETQRVDREGLKDVVSNLVNEVKPCYTHLPEDSMTSEEFSSMLLLDGCYLLCCFIEFQRPPAETCADDGSGHGSSSNSGAGGGASASASARRGGSNGIAADPKAIDIDNTLVRDILYLLENQIPLCVLEAILKYIGGTEYKDDPRQLIYKGVHDVLHKQHYISKSRQPVASSTPSDLLHLVYSYFRRAAPRSSCLMGTGRWRRATEYRKYADLQFRRREFQEKGQQWTILDVDLAGGTMYIPFLRVDTDTWTMLRNLMALEEQEDERPVTAYCLFMSQLACTAEDVQLLQEAKILQHFMPNDKEAARAFSYLCNGVAMDIDNFKRNYLKPVWHDLHERCGKRVHNFKGFFREQYCSTVFYSLVFLVAILGFVSDVTQAIYAVIAYHKPTSG